MVYLKLSHKLDSMQLPPERDSGDSWNSEEPDIQVFGRRIQAERKRLGLTQTQLATALGVSRITLAKYEAGRTSPDLHTLARGAQTIGLDLEYLVTGTSGEVALGPDAGWALIRRLLALVKRHLLRLQGQEITARKEAEIVRDLYLAVMASQPESNP